MFEIFDIFLSQNFSFHTIFNEHFRKIAKILRSQNFSDADIKLLYFFHFKYFWWFFRDRGKIWLRRRWNRLEVPKLQLECSSRKMYGHYKNVHPSLHLSKNIILSFSEYIRRITFSRPCGPMPRLPLPPSRLPGHNDIAIRTSTIWYDRLKSTIYSCPKKYD